LRIEKYLPLTGSDVNIEPGCSSPKAYNSISGLKWLIGFGIVNIPGQVDTFILQYPASGKSKAVQQALFNIGAVYSLIGIVACFATCGNKQ
jgi:hypothetical protein